MDYMREDHVLPSESDDFSTTLRTMGYSDNEISSAYFWLMNRFDNAPEQLFSEFPAIHYSNRILSTAERARMTTDAYGFLIKLLNHSLIDTEQFEMILDRAAVFGTDPISSEQVKLVASSVVFRESDDFSGDDMDDNISNSSILIN